MALTLGLGTGRDGETLAESALYPSCPGQEFRLHGCRSTNTAIFTLINTLLLRDLPVREPERLVQLSMLRQDSQLPFSYSMFRELVRGQRVFTGLISWGATGMSNVETNGVLSQSHIQAVTGNWYSELGARLSPFTHHGGIHDSNPLELSA